MERPGGLRIFFLLDAPVKAACPARWFRWSESSESSSGGKVILDVILYAERPTMRFFGVTVCRTFLSGITAFLAFGQPTKAPIGRSADIVFATGKALSSPGVWVPKIFVGGFGGRQDTDCGTAVQDDLYVRKASGVIEFVSQSTITTIDVRYSKPHDPSKIDDPIDVTLRGQDTQLTGTPTFLAYACIILPPAEVFPLQSEFPAGHNFPPTGQCITDLKSTPFAPIKNLLGQVLSPSTCPQLIASPPPLRLAVPLLYIRSITFKP